MAGKGLARDFQDVVDLYLERGEVYKPAEEFISKISLCPRYIGGGDKSKQLLQVILRMVNLVKEKEANARNKKSWKGWLKEAARALETYQVVNREWISRNVHVLPDLPVRKEQQYDPMAGRRDIRFYPSATAVEPREDVLDVQLSKEEEDALLMSSPEKASPVPSPIPIPRRSPRIAKKKPVELPETQLSETSSHGTGVSRHIPMARSPSSPEQHPPRRRDSGYFRLEASSPRKDVRPRHERRRKPVRESQTETSGMSVTSQEYISKSHRESLAAFSSGPVYSKPTERKVALGRGTTVEYPCVETTRGKRVAESLVISTSVLKKQRVEDILSQVKETRGERDQDRKSGHKSKSRHHQCWVPGCDEPQSYIKAHAFKMHVPGIFTETLPSSDPQVLRGRKKALMQAARWLLGRPATLDELLNFVNIQHLLAVADNTSITEVQHGAMVEMCHFLQCEAPREFTLEPANSPGVLIHWKAILLIAASLDNEEQQYWRDSFPGPGVDEPVETVKTLPMAFDSHFHLDRSLQQCGLPSHGSLDDVLKAVHVNREEQIQLTGTVAVFCDPHTYPSGKRLLDLPRNMFISVGIHPRHAHGGYRFVEQSVQDLSRILKNQRVKALGEVGLDHTEPMKNWHLQVDLLHKVLPLLQDEHVLVIHCRGMRNDCGTEAYLLLLHVLKQHVRPNHSIHLHCFAGNQYVLQRWLEVFPRTYFGFTNLVQSFRQDQIEALRLVEETRLLLESDAPYFPSMGTQKSSPGQLFTVAKAVAEYRGISVNRLLEITVENSRHLYQEQ